MQPAPTSTPSQGSCLSGCNLGTIQPGASATITLAATPRYVALHRVTASVLRARGDTSGLVDPNPANDVATATANVRAARSCEIIRTGTNAADTLFGTNFGGDRMLGLDGNDVLRGAAGDDCIIGGRGNDQLYGELGADVLEGGPGNDLLDGGRGNDRLAGGAGNDLLRAGTGTNQLSAGSGDDRVSARNGRRERINCGSGKDAVRADRTDDLTGCERRY